MVPLPELVGAVPDPLSETCTGVLLPLPAILNVAVESVADVGAKRTVRVVPPAGTFSGVAGGETRENGPAGSESVETVSVPLPLLVTVRFMVWVCPTVTLPKLRPGGETLITGTGVAGATPVPARDTGTGLALPLLVMLKADDCGPAAAWEKRTVRVVPAAGTFKGTIGGET